jgi:hypothetical protein
MDIGRRVREAHRKREEMQEEITKINHSEQTKSSDPVTQQQETPASANIGGIDWKNLIAANFGNPDKVIQPGESASRAFFRLRAEKPKTQTPEVFVPTSNVLVSEPLVPRTSSRATIMRTREDEEANKAISRNLPKLISIDASPKKSIDANPKKSTLTDALKPKEETSDSQAESTSESIESVTVLTSTPPSQHQPTVTTAEENGSSATDLAKLTLDTVATSATKPEISPVAMGLFGNSNPPPSVESSPSQPSTVIGKIESQVNAEAKQNGSPTHSTPVNTVSNNSPKNGKEDPPKLPPDNSWFNVFRF